MTANPTRILILVGVVAAALVAFFVARPMLAGDDESSGTTAPTKKAVAAKSAVKAKGKVDTGASVRLLPTVPAPLAKRLRYENVVVVSVYSARGANDRGLVGEASAGAKRVDAGFLALDVDKEPVARLVQRFAGSLPSPSVLIVKRPGTVVAQFDGFVDDRVVAQAAKNAGSTK